ncbi:MAG TPA: hypothetical protein VFT12_10390 [Thermoanaerobaculia bacterium]|nr:hypothetical protein [Thermoanaerobaculia bacterium]
MAFVLLTAAAPLVAQPDYRGEPGVFRHQIQMQVYHFDNFFQARGDTPEIDVTAAGWEYGAATRLTETGPDFFGALYVMNYDREGLATSYGGRAGIARYGSVHSFYGYIDRLQNGWSFDIAEETANANITSLYATYSYRVVRDWQLELTTYNEWQSFDVEETGYDGDYNQLEGEVRYRGFGRIFEPRIAYAVGQRDVDNQTDTYDYRHWAVEVTSRPIPNLDLSLRYRDRTRDYERIDRLEDRGQIQFRAILRHSDRLATTAMITHEDVNSSVPGRDFAKRRIFAGFTIGF